MSWRIYGKSVEMVWILAGSDRFRVAATRGTRAAANNRAEQLERRMRIFAFNILERSPAQVAAALEPGQEIYLFTEVKPGDEKGLATVVSEANQGKQYRLFHSDSSKQRVAALVSPEIEVRRHQLLSALNKERQWRDPLLLDLERGGIPFGLCGAHLPRRNALKRWWVCGRLVLIAFRYKRFALIGDLNLDLKENGSRDKGFGILQRVLRWVPFSNAKFVPTQKSRHRSQLDLLFTRGLEARAKVLREEGDWFDRSGFDHRPIAAELFLESSPKKEQKNVTPEDLEAIAEEYQEDSLGNPDSSMTKRQNSRKRKQEAKTMANYNKQLQARVANQDQRLGAIESKIDKIANNIVTSTPAEAPAPATQPVSAPQEFQEFKVARLLDLHKLPFVGGILDSLPNFALLFLIASIAPALYTVSRALASFGGEAFSTFARAPETAEAAGASAKAIAEFSPVLGVGLAIVVIPVVVFLAGFIALGALRLVSSIFTWLDQNTELVSQRLSAWLLKGLAILAATVAIAFGILFVSYLV